MRLDLKTVKGYFDLLEVEPGANLADIRGAYRDQVTIWHPDRFASNDRVRRKADDHTKRLNQAFDFLKEQHGGYTPEMFSTTGTGRGSSPDLERLQRDLAEALQQKDAAERRARHARQAQKQAEQHCAETDWYIQECQERTEELYGQIAGLKTQLCKANEVRTQAEERADRATAELEGLRQALEGANRWSRRWTDRAERARGRDSRRTWSKWITSAAVGTTAAFGLWALNNVIGTFPVLVASLFLVGTFMSRRFLSES